MGALSSVKECEKCLIIVLLFILIILTIASVPGLPRSVRVLIMRMRKTFKVSSGKAWDDSSRESRTVVGQYLARAPWSRCHFDSPFQAESGGKEQDDGLLG